jgi:hypothetical protein
MDKKIKVIPLKLDLKIIFKNIYFFIILYLIILFYQWVILEGINCKFTSLKLPMFTLFALGFLFFIIPLYMEIIDIKSGELLLSLPIGCTYYLYFRVIRIYLFYSLLVTVMFFFIYQSTNKSDFNGSFYDITFILGVSLFLANLGLFLMFLGKHLVWGYSIPMFVFIYSYFYRGTGLLYWHVCQWVQPKPLYFEVWKMELAIWITGIFLLFVSGFILKKKSYLI